MDQANVVEVSKGFLYVATEEKYFREAERSAKSLRAVSPNGRLCMATNTNLQSREFDDIIPLGHDDFRGKKGYISKAFGMQQTPYSKTIFVDTDTFFAEPVDELFDILDYYDLALAHDYMETSYAIIDGKPLDGYRTYNTGVLAFNKTPSIEHFLESWITRYLTKLDQYWSDQPALMEALLYSKLKVYSLQTVYNFRFNQFLTVPNGKVKILHGRHEEIEGIARLVNKSIDHRSWDPKLWRCHGWSEAETLWGLFKRAMKRTFIAK